ncbi:MAG: hypothetical protein Q9186_004313 [Xanthomendoza sp. 1 TL-2023]
MESPNPSVVFHDAKNNLLICRGCQFAINYRTTKEHFERYHDELNQEERRALNEWCATLSTCENLDEFVKRRGANADTIAEVEGIALHLEGLQCTYEGCGKIFNTADSTRKHMAGNHNCRGDEQKRLIHENVPWQQLFRNPNTYTPVKPRPRPPAPAKAPLDRFVQNLLKRHGEKMEMMVQSDLVPEAMHDTDTTPWLDRTRWAVHLRGMNMRNLVDATRLPAKEGEPKVTRACEITDTLLKELDRKYGPERCSRRVWQILEARKTDDVQEKVARFMSSEVSFNKCILEWKHFISYLLRAYTKEDERLQMTREQVELTTRLDAALGRDGNDEECAVLVFDISIAVLQQRMLRDVFVSPLMHFLAIRGINEKDLRFMTPNYYTPKLSAILQIIRRFHCEKAIPDENRDTMGDAMIDTLREYHRKYIDDNALTPIGEIRSQRGYGMKIAADHNAKPNVMWNDDMSVLSIGFDKVPLRGLKEMIHKTLEEAQMQMYGSLVFQNYSYLATRDPLGLSDNLQWGNNGFSFVHWPGNNLSRGEERVCEWASTTGKWSAFVNQGEDWILNKGEIKRYQEAVEKWLDLFLVLCHLTQGQPARGTELFSLKWKNTVNTARGFYVMDGTIMTVTEYHKGQNRQQAPRMLARFLPAAIGQLLVAYLSDVLPFLSFLLEAAGMDNPTSSPFMWTTKGKASETKRLTSALVRCTKEHLGVEVGTQNWRHIACAIARDKLKDGNPLDLDLEDEDEWVFDAQAGHSGAIASAHYAVRSDMLHGLTTDSTMKFRKASQLWHNFWGLTSKTSERLGGSLRRQKDMGGTLSDRSRIGMEATLEQMRQVPQFREHIELEETISYEGPEIRRAATKLRLLKTLHTMGGRFRGYKSKTQKHAMIALEDDERDLIVVLPTGGGKSLLFTIQPLLQSTKMVVVVIPYVAVLAQALRVCQSQGISAIEWQDSGEIFYPLVFVCLERGVTTQFSQYMERANEKGYLRMICFDEAHTVITERDFRHDMNRLGRVAAIAPRRIALTATLPLNMEEEMKRELHMGNAVTMRTSTARLNIQFRVLVVDGMFGDEEKNIMRIIQKYLSQLRPHEKALIFPRTKARCDSFAKTMGGIAYYNGVEDKDAALKEWLDADGKQTMVATSGISSGLDRESINLVVIANGANTCVELGQMSGRAARGTNDVGKCVVIVSGADMREVETEGLPQSDEEAFLRFITTKGCRRQVLAYWLDNEISNIDCRGLKAELCDNCEKPVVEKKLREQMTRVHAAERAASREKATRGIDDEAEERRATYTEPRTGGVETEGRHQQSTGEQPEGVRSRDATLRQTGAHQRVRGTTAVLHSLTPKELRGGTAEEGSTQVPRKRTFDGRGASLEETQGESWPIEEGDSEILMGGDSDDLGLVQDFSLADFKRRENLERAKEQRSSSKDVVGGNRFDNEEDDEESRSSTDEDMTITKEHVSTMLRQLLGKCSVCWLRSSSPNDWQHTFKQCKNDHYTFASYMPFKKAVKFEDKTCCFPCAAPSWVCHEWFNKECRWMDILLPLVMAAEKMRKYDGEFRDGLGAPRGDIAKFKTWMELGHKGNKDQRLLLEGRHVNNAILCFARITKRRMFELKRLERR